MSAQAPALAQAAASSSLQVKTTVLAAMAGVGVGFVAGFRTAEALYADEAAKQTMRRRAQVISAVAVTAAAFAAIGVTVVRHG